MITVAIFVTISVGFTACSKDNKEVDPIEIDSRYLFGQWSFSSEFNGYMIIEFRKDGTYSFEDINGTVDGIYGVTESKQTKDEEGRSAVLYKMLVSGSNEFDQFLVYYYTYNSPPRHINVHFYLDNKFVQYWGFINIADY
jgi:hypothetical protein